MCEPIRSATEGLVVQRHAFAVVGKKIDVFDQLRDCVVPSICIEELSVSFVYHHCRKTKQNVN